ncbi:armadillo repeat-containing protein 4 isoform X1 [Xiphophorus couchianus]|uniref:armadillo repeat-containing protein 4 isoform X1 n=1 Tax=Xiphophorus couchianus TaxID=32473 RepID=UPI001015DA89|nr:armadillo repeat-containing protein 4 isoform X1 [Xiphophorus couchianus]XP_027861642.1 armadillo repeat-containing protein 4 isoform X1 [Xiphophorus couchianus]
MGLILSRAAQWTSCCKLESAPLNEFLVTQVLNYVENFVSRHPQEAEHLFEEPLQWTTTLKKVDFKEDYVISAIGAKSLEKDSEGKPLLQYFPPFVSVRTISQLSKLLQLAADRKRQELQACLEENRDLIAKIVGQRLVNTPEENLSALELDIRVKLFILLKHIDEKILNKFVGEIAKQVKLLPAAVEEEVEFLKQYCTEGGKRLLKSLRYTSDYEFPNGCRAPPWRQLLGEICYVVIEPCDAEALYITCCSAGVFLNAGLDKEEDESLYERQGDFYEDMATLLKRVSPHFEKNVRKQYFVEQKPRKSIHVAHVDYEIEKAQPKTPEEREWEKVQQALYARKKREPCQRWRNLGVLSIFGSDEDLMMSAAEKKRLGSKTKVTMKVGLTAASSIGLTASQRRRSIVASLSEEHCSESSSESEEEEEQTERRPDTSTELQSEYWQVQKLVKYLKAADQTATVLVLCAMMDLDLMKEVIQLAILDLGGLELLLNLLDTTDIRSKIGSLKILAKISQNVIIRQTIVNMRGLQRMVNNLDLPVKELQALASETIAHVAKFRRARRTVRIHGGIRKLVKMLDCFHYSAKPGEDMEKNLEVARCGASALWSLSKSSKNKEAIRKAGGIPLLGLLLRSPYEKIAIPVVGTLQECASQKNYRVAIQNEGMVKDLVKNLSSDNEELQMLCASAIFKCAEDKLTRDLVRSHHGLQPLVSLLSKAENKQLLAAATGAIWKCSISMENVAIFQEYKALHMLIGLLTDQPEEVLVNVVGALGQFAQIQANKAAICNGGGIRALINLLNGTNQALLVNVAKAVGACATERDNVAIIDQLDGVRLVWSLLKNPNAEVQASAAWAICPCIENAKDAGEMVLFLIGGLKLIIQLLKSPSNEVLTSICAVIAKLAKDKEILGVLSDRGVVPLLAGLTNTTDDRLRCHLAEAIGHCCMWSSNRACFGDHGAVGLLVSYLESNDNLLLLNTTMALYQLSKDPNNIITMHEEGVVEPLVKLIASGTDEIQEFAAGCVRNIRLLVLANQRAIY